MKNFRFVVGAIAIGAIFGSVTPVFAADDGGALKQADDLVKQAWNPGGDPPSTDQRTQWVSKAIELAKSESDHRLKGQRVEAIRFMQQALESIKAGDEESKISEALEDADRDLRDSIERAESH